jgi:hypothetical protein
VLLAQIGPLTAGVEALATAVGAGVVLGSFAMGIGRVLAGQPRWMLEDYVLTDGLLGGLFGLTITLIDAIIRYGI